MSRPSSNVQSITYLIPTSPTDLPDCDAQMIVNFHNGSAYMYSVPYDKIAHVDKAPSLGKFVWAMRRRGYKFVKL